MTSPLNRSAAPAVCVDGSHERLRSPEEVQLAIYAIIDAAFGPEVQSRHERDAIQASLPPTPTAIQVIDAVLAHRRRLGPLDDEKRQRGQAGMAMALFLLLDSSSSRTTSSRAWA